MVHGKHTVHSTWRVCGPGALEPWHGRVASLSPLSPEVPHSTHPPGICAYSETFTALLCLLSLSISPILPLLQASTRHRVGPLQIFEEGHQVEEKVGHVWRGRGIMHSSRDGNQAEGGF